MATDRVDSRVRAVINTSSTGVQTTRRARVARRLRIEQDRLHGAGHDLQHITIDRDAPMTDEERAAYERNTCTPVDVARFREERADVLRMLRVPPGTDIDLLVLVDQVLSDARDVPQDVVDAVRERIAKAVWTGAAA